MEPASARRRYHNLGGVKPIQSDAAQMIYTFSRSLERDLVHNSQLGTHAIVTLAHVTQVFERALLGAAPVAEL